LHCQQLLLGLSSFPALCMIWRKRKGVIDVL
jgi:hypothetical protein